MRFAIAFGLVLPLLAQQTPVEKEAALGRRLAEEALRRSPPLDSRVVQSYVRTLGERLGRHVPDAPVAFSFTVTENGGCRIAHEPIALPGGHILVSAGLLLAVEDEGELAGMLAHAMAHVAQRHGFRQDTAMPVFLVGGGADCLGAAMTPVRLVAARRKDEVDADVLAVQTMARGGFDPNAVVRYVVREQAPQLRPNSPMADREARAEAMRSAIQGLAAVPVSGSSEEFARAKEEVARLRKQTGHR